VAPYSEFNKREPRIEGITHQPPKPPFRSTWILETLTPQNRKLM
jgi:hypothetical protein